MLVGTMLITVGVPLSILNGQSRSIELQSATIIVQIDNRPATMQSVISNWDDKVDLIVLVRARLAGLFSSTYISPVDSIDFMSGGLLPKQVETWKITGCASPLIRWYLLTPTRTDSAFSNRLLSIAPYPRIVYQEVPIPEWNNLWQVSINDWNRKDLHFPGTIWFKAEVGFADQFVSTGGIESRMRVMENDYGGLDTTVFRLSIRGRTNCRFVDNLLLFRNIPYIQNPVSWNGIWEDHQTMRWIGGNWETFLMAAAWFSGESLLDFRGQLPVPEKNQFRVTEYYQRHIHLNEGIYQDQKQNPVTLSDYLFGPGDFIIKGDQSAVMFRDLGGINDRPNRQLDAQDLVLYCRNASVAIGTVSQVMGDTLSLVRWKKRR